MTSDRTSSRPASVAPALLALAALGFAPAIDGTAPEDDLRARVHGADSMGEGTGASVVSIQVTNEGTDAVEPLAFRITPVGEGAESLTVARVPGPLRKRAGRVVAPRGRARFPIAVHVEAHDLEGALVEVVEVGRWSPESPSADLGLRARDVKVGRPRVEQAGEGAWSVAQLENRSGHHIDVVLAATYTNDGGGRCLTGARLAPGETIEHEMRSVRSHPFGGEELVPRIEVSRLEVVDWSARTDPGGDEALEVMADVWDSWISVAEESLPLNVRFSVRVEHLVDGDQGAADLDRESTGQLWVRPDRRVQFATDAGELMRDGVLFADRYAVESALAWVVREPFGDAVEDWELALLRSGPPTEVRLSGAPKPFGRSAVDLRLEGGAIVAASFRGGLEGGGDTWEVTSDGERWRLDSIQQSLGTDRELTTTARYVETGGATVLEELEILDGAAYVEVDSVFVRVPQRTRIRFEDWRFGVEPPPELVAPTGDLADRLRPAWDGFYRYPDPRVELIGQYEVDVRGGDGVWIGHSSVEGTFSLRHFHRGGWRHRTVTCSDRRLAGAETEVLINAVEDRIGMWSGRVPCWFADFDETFAGTSLSAGEERDWILVEGHPTIDAVKVDRGRIEAVRQGSETSFRWKKATGGALLPVVVEREGNGRVELKWDEVEPGWWFPTRAHFTEIFGRDWGPETLKMDVEWIGPLD